jgi:aspartate/methionine/tyrosine aminotransferase
MKPFAPNLSKIMGEAAFEVLAKAQALESKGKSVLHFEIGEPDFDTPKQIVKAAKEALDNGFTHYVASDGILELKEAICEHINECLGYRPAIDQVIILPGVKPGIFFSMLALIEKGDEVIYPNPGYPTYPSMTRYLGAKEAPIYLKEANQFGMKASEIENKISPRTKLIIINSPHNPTGGICSEKDLEEISAIAAKHGIWIVSDEIYSHMVYVGKHFSITQLDGARERTILLDGFSKSYAMTGWRLGWLVGPKKLVERMKLLPLNAVSCTTSFVQRAGIKALKDPAVKEWMRTMLDKFRKRRDIIVSGLNSIKGFKCLLPKGAFYAYPNIEKTGMKSEEIAEWLLYKLGVATLPGTAFGSGGEGFLRFSYASSLGTIQESIERMKEALNK